MANTGLGQPGGLAQLDGNGKLMSGQIPAYAYQLNEGTQLGGRDDIPNYDQYLSSPDANGTYTVLTLKRPGTGSTYMVSTLSNPVTGTSNYQTDTWQFYDSAATPNLIATHVWSITYDANGKISQKVMTS